jgi:hypothetical protein
MICGLGKERSDAKLPRSPGAFSAPHWAQLREVTVTHSEQNFLPTGLSTDLSNRRYLYHSLS